MPYASAAASATNCHGCVSGSPMRANARPIAPIAAGPPTQLSFYSGWGGPSSRWARPANSPLSCRFFFRARLSFWVCPAPGFALLAKRNGARLVIINREATEFDEIADVVIRQDIGTVLSPFIVH